MHLGSLLTGVSLSHRWLPFPACVLGQGAKPSLSTPKLPSPPQIPPGSPSCSGSPASVGLALVPAWPWSCPPGPLQWDPQFVLSCLAAIPLSLLSHHACHQISGTGSTIDGPLSRALWRGSAGARGIAFGVRTTSIPVLDSMRGLVPSWDTQSLWVNACS